MEYVEAFRRVEDINSIKRYLKKHSERDYTLFVIGINTGLKINEILELKCSDVLTSENIIKEYLKLKLDDEKETSVYVNAKVRIALQDYLEKLPTVEDSYLFMSPKTNKPITRQQAHRIIHQAVEGAGIEGKYGASSMRKTYGYHAYKQGVSVSLIQKHFHHGSLAETMKYLGISEEEKIKTIIDVNL